MYETWFRYSLRVLNILLLKISYFEKQVIALDRYKRHLLIFYSTYNVCDGNLWKLHKTLVYPLGLSVLIIVLDASFIKLLIIFCIVIIIIMFCLFQPKFYGSPPSSSMTTDYNNDIKHWKMEKNNYYKNKKHVALILIGHVFGLKNSLFVSFLDLFYAWIVLVKN